MAAADTRVRSRAALRAAAPMAFALAALVAAAWSGAAAQPVEPAATAPPTIAYVIEDGQTIPTPLSALRSGDPTRGAALVTDPAKGNCVACHSFSPGAPSSGPSLHDVGSRLSQSALRLWVVNPAALAPETSMPAYYSLYPTRETEEPLAAPTLTAEEVEDVVAYLNSLGARTAPFEAPR